MTSRNGWVKMVLGVVALAALLMTGLAQAQPIVNPASALQVTLHPDAAVTSGAQWRIMGEPTWLDSGYTEYGLTTGTHMETVEFKPIPGWIWPDDQGLLIVDSQVNVTSATYTPAPAETALQVFIEPAAVVAAGAQWRIQGEFTYHNSGFVRTGLTSGSVIVEFSAVGGWVAPDSQNIAILTDQTVGATGTYTIITALQVFMQPPGAVTGGAQWRIQGEPIYHNNGFIETGLTSGPVVVEFRAINGWVAPDNLIVAILTGQTVAVFGTYTIAPSVTALQVFIEPAAVVGAQWSIHGDPTLRNSGDVLNLTSGTYVVDFSNVGGWVTPLSQSVPVPTGQTAVTTGTYVQIPPTTGLIAFIEPPAAVTAGAQWRILGEPSFHDSSTAEMGLTAGAATVEFKSIVGWGTPANQDVTIVTGQVTPTSATYTLLAGGTGLQVFITPTSATLAGAKWRVVSATTTTLFLNNGVIAAGLTSGPAVVEFSAVTGWIAPANQNVTILADQLVVTTGTYTLAPPVVTALQVFIEPPEAVNAGAMWRIQGEITYNPSGFVETNLTAGPAVVEFSAVADWVAPANQDVTLVTGQTVVTSGTYVAAGSLQITILPAAAVAAGAQWRRVGTTAYLSSDAIESVPAGTYAVEFKPTPGWTAPANLTDLVVVVGQTIPGTGTYTELVGGAPGDYKISYKGCSIALDSTTPGAARGLIVTGASGATIKIQKLTKVPPKHADVPGKTLYMLNSPGLVFLTAPTGTIKSLSGTGAFIPLISANITGSIKMGVAALLPAIQKPATSIVLPGTPADAPRAAVPTLKVSLTGVSLDNFVMTNEAASIKIAAKKVKGVTIPADVTAGAIILVGNGLSLSVAGGNVYADLVESQGAIKSLTAKTGNIGADPATATSATQATLDDNLTSPTVAVLLHPSTPVVVSFTGGFGTIGGANVQGVFVAGAGLVNGLVHPTCSAAVKTWKATNASGDAFVSAAAKSQPAGIAAHTTAP